MIKQKPTVAAPGSALPAFQEYSGVTSDCVCGGEELLQEKPKPGIFITLQKSWGCVCSAEPSQLLPLGVAHVVSQKSPVYFVFLGFLFLGFCSHPAFAGLALQPQEKSWQKQGVMWGC